MTATISPPTCPAPTASACGKPGPRAWRSFPGSRYLLTEEFRLNEQDLLALFERHGYDLVLMEGFKESGWPKIEVVRKRCLGGAGLPLSRWPSWAMCRARILHWTSRQALADWIAAQMPAL